MILSFSCKETQKIFSGYYTKKLPANLHELAMRKLRMLDNAIIINDLKIPPGNRLESLQGKRKGEYSIRINNQWRICFRWSSRGAEKVKIEDYH